MAEAPRLTFRSNANVREFHKNLPVAYENNAASVNANVGTQNSYNEPYTNVGTAPTKEPRLGKAAVNYNALPSWNTSRLSAIATRRSKSRAINYPYTQNNAQKVAEAFHAHNHPEDMYAHLIPQFANPFTPEDEAHYQTYKSRIDPKYVSQSIATIVPNVEASNLPEETKKKIVNRLRYRKVLTNLARSARHLPPKPNAKSRRMTRRKSRRSRKN